MNAALKLKKKKRDSFRGILRYLSKGCIIFEIILFRKFGNTCYWLQSFEIDPLSFWYIERYRVYVFS